MGELRRPFFLVALAAILLAVLVELGSGLLLGTAPGGGITAQAGALGVDAGVVGTPEPPPGIGVRYLVLVDVIVLYTVGLMAIGLVVPERLTGRLQGISTLIASIILIVVSIVLLFLAVALLLLMVGLLAAVPFGIIAYVALFGFFPRGDAAVLLSLVMFLKLVFCVALVLAQPRFLQNRGLVLLVLTSLVANLLVAFLHGLVPGLLVSITDGVAAIVLTVLAIIWGIVLLIGSIPAVVKAIKA
jgi:hypothetical protein